MTELVTSLAFFKFELSRASVGNAFVDRFDILRGIGQATGGIERGFQNAAY